MLSRKNRIPKNEFPSFKSKGFRFVSDTFTGTIYPNPKEVRISVVVSKKTASKAVDRNYLRRRTYSAVEPLIKKLNQGVLIVFYPKKEASKKPLHYLQAEIESSLKKAKILE